MENILSSKLFTTRRGTVILGVGAAVLAAIVLLVYLKQYRNSVNGGTQPVSVLVAKSLIQKGTPGDVVGSTGLFQVTSIPKDQVKNGAFVDPKSLSGQVATTDIFPGQQMTADDFAAGTAAGLTQKLASKQRAVEIGLGSTAALAGQLQPGNHVDIWAGLNAQTGSGAKPVIRQVMQDVTVVAVGGSSGGIGSSSSGNVTFRVTPAQAGKILYAQQNGEVFLVLRPTAGGSVGPPLEVTSQSLLGVPAVQVGGK